MNDTVMQAAADQEQSIRLALDALGRTPGRDPGGELVGAAIELQAERDSLAELVDGGTMPFVRSQVALKARVAALEAEVNELCVAYRLPMRYAD